MAKEILIGAFFLVLGAGAGVFFFAGKADNAPVQSSETNITEKSQVISEAPIERKTIVTKAEVGSLNLKVARPELKEAIMKSFNHPEAYAEAIEKLNEDPHQSLNEIKNALSTLGPDQDGVRNHLVNLAMQTDATKVEKGEFLSHYLTSSRFNAHKKDIADDSYSAVVAIDYLGQNFQDEEEARTYISEILAVENEDLREQLKLRLQVYYSEVK